MALVSFAAGDDIVQGEECISTRDGQGVISSSGATGVWVSDTPAGSKCMQIFIKKPSSTVGSKCRGVFPNTVPKAQPKGQGDFVQLEVRAIRYAPRPLGVKPEEDVYDIYFKYINDRDLEGIAKSSRANTIILDPWDIHGDHSNFLNKCRDLGLYVIPTFDFASYVNQSGKKGVEDGDLRKNLAKDFQAFLEVADKNPGWPILGWALNYGPSVRKAIQGWSDPSKVELTEEVTIYFSLLCTLRHTHRTKEYNPVTEAYKRPLAIPLDLATVKTTSPADDIAFYMGLAETDWGSWPDCPTWRESPSPLGIPLAPLRKLGAFDMWILKGTLRAEESDIQHSLTMLDSVNFNTAANPSRTRQSVWHDIRSRKAEGIGDVFPDCQTGCTYPTRKAVLVEYGVQSEGKVWKDGAPLMSKTDPESQMQHLQQLWYGLRDRWNKRRSSTTCTSGFIVNQWTDDKNFDETNLCDVRPEEARCSLPQNQWPPLRTGLNSEFAMAGMSCIWPHTTNESWFCFQDENGNIPSKPCLSKIDVSQWSPNSISKVKYFMGCRGYASRLYGFTTPIPDAVAGLLWCVLLFIVPSIRFFFYTRKLIRIPLEKSSSNGEDGLELSPIAVPKEEDKPIQVEGNFHQCRVPDEFSVSQIKSIQVRSKLELKTKDDLPHLQDLAKIFVLCAYESQNERLKSQVKAEAYVEAAKHKDEARARNPRKEDWDKAVKPIYTRAMEGYLVWMDKFAAGTFATPTDPSTKYAYILLLRMLECLAEQALHSPEWVAYHYHKLLDEAGALGQLTDNNSFTIDVKQLHSGLEEMKKKSNPFEGGIGFDDINDCALAAPQTDRLTPQKTFYESRSVFVIFDCLSNFQPVFTVKLWGFFIAWWCYYRWLVMKEGPQPEDDFSIVRKCFVADACVLFFVEVFTLLNGWLQGRFSWKNSLKRWISRHISGFITACLGLLISVQNVESKVPGDIKTKVAGYATLRVLHFLAFMVNPRLQWRSTAPFVLDGRRKRSAEVSNTTTTTTTDGSIMRDESSSTLGFEQVDDESPMSEDMGTLKKLLVWCVVLTACGLFETFLVVPLVFKMHHAEFCGASCDGSAGFGSACLSCMGAIAMVWALVATTAFFDIYFVFYVATAVVGYFLGHRAGLSRVLEAQRELNMATTQKREAHSLEDYKTDGSALRDFFGPSWRKVWSRMVETLHQDDMVTPKQADKLVDAVGTVRWDVIKKYDRNEVVNGKRFRQIQKEKDVIMVTTTDMFQKLRFQPAALRKFKKADDAREALAANASSAGATYGTGSLAAGTGPLQPQEVIKSIWIKPAPDAKEGEEFPCKREKADSLACVCDLGTPRPVHEFSFTLGEKEDFDPVVWTLEGQLPNNGEWMELFAQEARFVPERIAVPPRQRYFAVELYRKYKKGKELKKEHRYDKSYYQMKLDHLEKSGAVERIMFFVTSLRNMVGRASHSEELKVSFTGAPPGALPSVTQILPCYNETVIIATDVLRKSDGINTNLGFQISMCPDEWASFSQRMGCTGPRDLFDHFMSPKEMDPELEMEVRLWASMRSQTVVRTIVGALQYPEVLRMILPDEGDTKICDELGQLIIAHQTFGNKMAGMSVNDISIMYLLNKYKDKPVSVVFDYSADQAHDTIKGLVNAFIASKLTSAKQIKLSFASVRVTYKGDGPWNYKVSPHRIEELYKNLKIEEVIARFQPLRLGSGHFATQGKAGNQLGALRFAKGHFLQMMDANMGATFGEACKVPFVVKKFLPRKSRTAVECRILGFREVIFTKDYGMVGDIMASAEWTFGTICQRFLAGLNARMHYGHPDFIDGFWASNRGSLSKASAGINLSEDIFAGFNARMRGEKSYHTDLLAWEKGRECSFNAASGFFFKISSGSVGVMRSRDLKILSENLNIVDNISFYFASIGFYFNNWLIDISLNLYVFCFVMLALAGKDLNDVGQLGSMLAAEWAVSVGTIAMLPRLIEFILEFGFFEGIMIFFPSVIGQMIAFAFINKSVAAAVGGTMITGEAGYVETGRPDANKHYTWYDNWKSNAKSHYLPAINILMGYLLYYSTSKVVGGDALPMWVVNMTALVWIMAPILFCPQPTWSTLGRDASEFWTYIVTAPQHEEDNAKLLEERLKVNPCLYSEGLLQHLEHLHFNISHHILKLAVHFTVLVVYAFLVNTRIWVCVSKLAKFWVGHCLVLEVWRSQGRPEIVMFSASGVAMLPIVLYPEMIHNMFGSFIFLKLTLNFARVLILLGARMFLRPHTLIEAEQKRDKSDGMPFQTPPRVTIYEGLVEYCYVNFMEYELLLAKGGFVFIVSLVTQTTIVMLDYLTGLHSAIVLNRNLGYSQGVLWHHKAYTPKVQAERTDVEDPRPASARAAAAGLRLPLLPLPP